MFLIATADNIDTYMEITVEEIMNLFYSMDNKLQEAIPSIKFLAEKYGDKQSTRLIDFLKLKKQIKLKHNIERLGK